MEDPLPYGQNTPHEASAADRKHHGFLLFFVLPSGSHALILPRLQVRSAMSFPIESIRAQFPALSQNNLVFFDNPGGTQVP